MVRVFLLSAVGMNLKDRKDSHRILPLLHAIMSFPSHLLQDPIYKLQRESYERTLIILSSFPRPYWQSRFNN